MKLLNFTTIAIATIAASTTLRTAQAAKACVTADECKARSKALGIEDFYVGDFPSKGCFKKNDKAFFSEGTEDEMSATNLDGQQKRIWCEGDSSNDLIPMDQLLPIGGSESSAAGVSAFTAVVLAATSFVGVAAAHSL